MKRGVEWFAGGTGHNGKEVHCCTESFGLCVLSLAAVLSRDPQDSVLGRACSLSVCILSSWALACHLAPTAAECELAGLGRKA